METRLEIIKKSFEKEQEHFLSSFSKEVQKEEPKEVSKKISKKVSKEEKSEDSSKLNESSLEETILNKLEKEPDIKEVKTPKTPILLNKINKHKYDLGKNNMKRKQIEVECTGVLGDDLDTNDMFFKKTDDKKSNTKKTEIKQSKTIKDLE